MHVHSVRSDGLYSALQLAQLARRSGLRGIVVTDHDALPDPSQLEAAEALSGVHMLPGVELSTQWQGRGLHVLGYGFDVRCDALRKICREVQDRRRERMRQMVEQLAAAGVRLPHGGPESWSRSVSLGRLHLARELVRAGHVHSVRAAFSKYLDKLAANSMSATVALPAAVEALHEAGGFAVLAHPPVRLSVDFWRSVVETGLDGLEVRHPSISKCHQRFLADRVAEYDLLATAGSDFHGDDSRRYLGSHALDGDQLQVLLAGRPRWASSLTT